MILVPATLDDKVTGAGVGLITVEEDVARRQKIGK